MIFSAFLKRLGFAGLFLLSPLPSLFCAPGDENWDGSFGVPGINGEVRTIAVHGHDVYFGGQFTSAGGINATNIARWDGTNWSNLGDGLSETFFPGGGAYSIAFVGNTLFAGGAFRRAGGIAATNIAKWDGTNWSNLGNGLNAIPFVLTSKGGDLYAGGNFTLAGTVQGWGIAKWDGTNWMALPGTGVLHPVAGASVGALLWRGNELYVGGSFHSAGNVGATNVARFDGTNWFGLGNGINGFVSALAVETNSIIAGGGFTRAGTIFTSGIARWNGVNWSSFSQSGTGVGGRLYDLVNNGTEIFAAGVFEDIDGLVLARNIARWDGVRWNPLGSGISSAITLATSGIELYAGGNVTDAGGKPSTNIALWHIPHSLDVTNAGNTIALSWPATGSNFTLEASGSVTSSTWTNVSPTPIRNGDQLIVSNSISSSNQFFRLRR